MSSRLNDYFASTSPGKCIRLLVLALIVVLLIILALITWPSSFQYLTFAFPGFDQKTRQAILATKESADSVTSFLNSEDVSMKSQYAFVTLLSSDSFLPGTAVLVESLKLAETSHDIVVMVLPHVSAKVRLKLSQMGGVRIVEIDYVINPYSKQMVAYRQKHNFCKLRAWLLTDYERIVLIDSDIIVFRNVDDLFDTLEDENVVISAVKNYNSPFASSTHEFSFNSGLIVLRPSVETFKDMMDAFFRQPPSNNGGDQGFLNTYFPIWNELSISYNLNKMMLKYSPKLVDSLDHLRILHFVRAKPWFDIARHTEYQMEKQLMNTRDDYKRWIDLWKRINFQINMRNADISTWFLANYTSVQFYANSKTHTFRIIENFCPNAFSIQCFNETEWFSNNKQPNQLTVTTHLTFDRLHRLERLCSTWEGLVTATIWVSAEEMELFLTSLLFSNIPLERVLISLVIGKDSLYPINMMRNLAINMAPTDLFLYVDVDFALPPLSFKQMKQQLKTDEILWKSTEWKHVIVVPAFEPALPFCSSPFEDDIENSCVHIPWDKKDVLNALDYRVINLFHDWKKGHRQTNIDRWAVTDVPYYVEWELWFEPYLIMRKSAFSTHKIFDERFHDRGRNKLTLPHELHLKGFKFVVHPWLFLIHDYEDGLMQDENSLPDMRLRDQLYADFEQRVEESLNETMKQTEMQIVNDFLPYAEMIV